MRVTQAEGTCVQSQGSTEKNGELLVVQRGHRREQTLGVGGGAAEWGRVQILACEYATCRNLISDVYYPGCLPPWKTDLLLLPIYRRENGGSEELTRPLSADEKSQSLKQTVLKPGPTLFPLHRDCRGSVSKVTAPYYAI